MDISVQNSSATALTANSLADLFAALLKIQESNYKELNNQVVVGKEASKASADAMLESGIHQAEQLYYEMVDQAVEASVSTVMSSASMAYAAGGSNLLMKTPLLKNAPSLASLKEVNAKLEATEANINLIKTTQSHQVNFSARQNGTNTQFNQTISDLRMRNFDTPLIQQERDALGVVTNKEREELLARAEKQQDRLETKKSQHEGQIQQLFQNFSTLSQIFTGISKAVTASKKKEEMMLKAHADYAKQLADWGSQIVQLNNQISTSLLNSISSALESLTRVREAIEAANRAA